MANIETVLKQIGKRGQEWALSPETRVTEVDATLSMDHIIHCWIEFKSFGNRATIHITPDPKAEGYSIRFEVAIPAKAAATPGDAITRLKFQLAVAELAKAFEAEFGGGRVYTSPTV